MRITKKLKYGLLLIFLFIAGCGSPTFESVNKELFKMTYWTDSAREHQAEAIQQEIKQSLSTGDINKAQKLILDSRRDNIEENRLRDLYTEVANRLHQKAEQSVATDQPDKAGLLFRMTRDIYPKTPQIVSTINLTLAELDNKIDQCADKLMEKGLVAYRSGELGKAVKIWEEISLFHTNHSSSQIAISTTKQQLENLEKLAPKNTI